MVTNEDLGLRRLLCFDDGVKVPVVQRKRLLHKYIFVLLEGEDCLRRMECIHIANQHHVHVRRCDELLGVGGGLGRSSGDFLAAVLESRFRGVTEVCNLEVA